MFDALEKIDARPEPFEFYTANELWANDHTSKKMLSYHLDGDIDLSSRNAGFIDRSVDWIASHFSVSPGMEIADFGCGPGLYTTALARKEANVTGIDFSTNSIVYAREVAMRVGLSIRYVVQDYLEFETDNRFDLILMIMCDFCALSPVQRRDLLSRFHTMLTPGGSVLLDVYSLSTFDHTDEQERYGVDISDGLWSANKYYGFHKTFKYESEKLILDKYTIVEASRTRTVYNWLQCFSPEQLANEFAECGFSIDEFFSDVAGSAFESTFSEFAVVGRKS